MIIRVNVQKSGNWSDPDIWYGGIFPSINDAVYLNGNTVVIDQDIEVFSLTNEQTYEDIPTLGELIVNDNITIKADIFSGLGPLINFNGSEITIIGTIEGPKKTWATASIINEGIGTINVYGTIKGGWGEGTNGIINKNTGCINLSGDLYFGMGSNSYAIYNENNGKIIINGIESTENGGYGGQPQY